MKWLLVVAFQPSQPQRITPGLNTNFNHLQVIHSKSHYMTSLFFLKPQLEFYPQFRDAKQKNNNTQRRNLHPAGWNILFCWPTQEPVLATANTGKSLERFGEKCKWMDRRVENNVEEIPGSKCSVYGYILPGSWQKLLFASHTHTKSLDKTWTFIGKLTDIYIYQPLSWCQPNIQHQRRA